MPDAILDERQLELAEIGYDPHVRYHQLKSLGIPYSRQHIAALETQGKFPRRTRLSPNVIAWRLSELREWMNARGRE